MPIESDPVQLPDMRCSGVNGSERCDRSLPLPFVQAKVAESDRQLVMLEIWDKRQPWIVRVDQGAIYCHAHRNQGVIPAV
jgi:hypothetical protein